MESRITGVYACVYCRDCLRTIGNVGEDNEQALWGHIQMEHTDVFEDIVDTDTPDMLETCYVRVL